MSGSTDLTEALDRAAEETYENLTRTGIPTTAGGFRAAIRAAVVRGAVEVLRRDISPLDQEALGLLKKSA